MCNPAVSPALVLPFTVYTAAMPAKLVGCRIVASHVHIVEYFLLARSLLTSPTFPSRVPLRLALPLLHKIVVHGAQAS